MREVGQNKEDSSPKKNSDRRKTTGESMDLSSSSQSKATKRGFESDGRATGAYLSRRGKGSVEALRDDGTSRPSSQDEGRGGRNFSEHSLDGEEGVRGSQGAPTSVQGQVNEGGGPSAAVR